MNIVVNVTSAALGKPLPDRIKFWLVVADSREEAFAIMRKRVLMPDDQIEAKDWDLDLSAHAIDVLKLRHGDVYAI